MKPTPSLKVCPLTWAQIATKMQNTALAAFDPVLTRLNQVANSAQFNTVINGAINGLAMLATVATGVLDLLINGPPLWWTTGAG